MYPISLLSFEIYDNCDFPIKRKLKSFLTNVTGTLFLFLFKVKFVGSSLTDCEFSVRHALFRCKRKSVTYTLNDPICLF